MAKLGKSFESLSWGVFVRRSRKAIEKFAIRKAT
jgi:hypothetical protein